MGVGIQLTGPAGVRWVMKPELGGLKSATAGFSIPLGSFSASWTHGGRSGTFETPKGTTGSLVVSRRLGFTQAKVSGSKGSVTKSCGANGDIVVDGLTGGKYSVSLK